MGISLNSEQLCFHIYFTLAECFLLKLSMVLKCVLWQTYCLLI